VIGRHNNTSSINVAIKEETKIKWFDPAVMPRDVATLRASSLATKKAGIVNYRLQSALRTAVVSRSLFTSALSC
jgi:hypothetical protein